MTAGGGNPLDELYQEVILDHSRRPRGAGLREPFAVEVHRVNPLCGDEITLRIALERAATGARLVDVSYEASGCSISVAATSVLAEGVTGGTVAAALARYERFHALVTGGGSVTASDESAVLFSEEDDEAAFAGVARFPRRVKCALLGWSALREALVRAAD